MDVLSRLANSIVVPVVVIDDAKDAVPTAKAMAAGVLMSWKSLSVPLPLPMPSRLLQKTAPMYWLVPVQF